MLYDVVVIGGAFSGASTALLLKRRNPSWSVLVVEKAEQFDRKVGESTTEVSSCFLTRVLGLSQYLGHEQLPKQGLRMWFAKGPSEPAFDRCVEVGARYNSRLAGFQVDRSTLDEHVLRLAAEAGAELWRPAKVTGLELAGIGANTLSVQVGDEVRQVRARWVVDASGRAAVVARKLGWWRPLKAHPISSIWARFRGVKDWDGPELRLRFPKWADAVWTARGWATNHLTGLGWWCWIIPLKGGDVSVGLVYDERLFSPPTKGTIGERLQAHFQQHPVGREILGQAVPIPGDQRAFSALPYCSERVADAGWALVGDAAGFIDPLYSPGLDFCAYTAHTAHSLIGRSLEGVDVAAEVADYNRRFSHCYHAWFDAIYRDKYYYLGDAELMAAAFLLDGSSYHLGPVRQVYADPDAEFSRLPFDGVPGRVVRAVLSFFNRRLARLAQQKVAAGVYGDRNADWRLLVGGFLPDGTSGKLFLRGVLRWLRAEWRGLWMRPVPLASKSAVEGSILLPVRE